MSLELYKIFVKYLAEVDKRPKIMDRKQKIYIMSRERQIIDAGIEYTMQNNPICIGGDNFYEASKMRNRNSSFEAGAKWADKHPKSPWISVKEDLPCNHPELMDSPIHTVRVFVNTHEDVLITRMIYRSRKWEWFWDGEITHWMPIPEPPKE